MIRLLTTYVLTAAARDRLLLMFLLLAVVGVSLSIFMGSSAVTEKDQFTVVFAAGGLRLAGLLTLVLFVVFYLRRSFESRDVEYLLSRPVSRLQFLLAHSLAFSLLATLIAILTTAVLYMMPSVAEKSGYILWGLSIWAEFLIMVNVALFFAMVLPSAVTGILCCMAFYVLARLMGDILGIIDANAGESALTLLMEKVMLVVSVVIPRLDLMGQTSWLVYGVENALKWHFILLQGFVFWGLMMAASLLDLKRRQF